MHQRYRSSHTNLPENPLRMLRSGNLPMIKPRLRTNSVLTDFSGTQSLGKQKTKLDMPLSGRYSASDINLKIEIANGNLLYKTKENPFSKGFSQFVSTNSWSLTYIFLNLIS